ncbi:formyl transferase [Rhizobacter sp. AJA081-3]|uniref:methionyl-tRNA formyltransferase n=1 Tax=Rhizobacter sp. AJA081-3 TaxID=2753607 RepID=UPI001AE013D3|nr:formyltransferase family protein [Rhizobacter sp. AJA081-3]QTN24270.1 formyl transferase [Rhizobacter sp. AJA081-3]
MTLRIAFVGCVESSRVALQSLLDIPTDTARLVGVLTRRASTFNADFVDLAPLARQAGLPLLVAEDAPEDAEQAAWLEQVGADLVFCVGWSKLLGPRTLGAAPRGIVGFHPAALPANRGRHPLVWALALGLEQTASSFFFMRAEADSGPVLSQQAIPILPTDDASTLYAKVVAALRVQIPAIVQGLARGTLQAIEQDHGLANHWRRRGMADGQIDWRMSAEAIHNLVRALARPYPGAHFIRGDQPVKVWRCETQAEGRMNLEPGKVLAVDGRQILVKCGSHAVRLLDHELAELPLAGDYL